MAGISITVDIGEASAELQSLMDRMANLRPFYESVGDQLIRSAGLNFERQSGPDGKPWTPLKPATIGARVRNRQTPITILQSNTKGKQSSLAGSINKRVDEDGVIIGSPKEYAAIHQLGGTIQKAAGTRWMAGRRFAKRHKHPEGAEVAIRAHTITIPARPFLGLSAQDVEILTSDALDHLTR